MALVAWNDKYKVGIWLMDTQHQRWIGLINDLYKAMKVGKGKDIVERTLDEMVNYTRTHFADEETLVSTHAWPEYAKHKALHDEFVGEVIELQKRHKAGELAISIKVLTKLQDWFVKHIQITDREVAAFLKSKGVQ